MSNVIGSVIGGGGNGSGDLRGALNNAMQSEKQKPSTLHFTVYDEGGTITTHDWFTSTTATHTDLDDAIQHCIDNLTTGRTAYESIRINLGGTLNEQVVISDDWTELVFSGETITAATGLNEYMFFAGQIRFGDQQVGKLGHAGNRIFQVMGNHREYFIFKPE